MRIFTSYYKNMESNGWAFENIQVSNTKPSWFPWAAVPLKEVYPDYENVSKLKSGQMSENEFSELYMRKLDQLNKKEVIEKIYRISAAAGNKDVMLLCYEKPTSFCHRHILAEWLDSNVREWSVEDGFI